LIPEIPVKPERLDVLSIFEEGLASHEAPNPKHQSPNNDRNLNGQTFGENQHFISDWSFRTGYYLEIGIW
jgi:hypothetical protein